MGYQRIPKIDTDARPASSTQAKEEAPRTAAELMPLVYDRLRALAHSYLDNERDDHSLQPTALVHEAYLRLNRIQRMNWNGRTHFFAMAATQMRRILVESARRVNAQKRRGRRLRITLTERIASTQGPSIDLIALDQALEKLEQVSPRQCRVAELRLFSGMLVNETAEVVGVSPRTVKKDWSMAQAWLSRELAPSSGR